MTTTAPHPTITEEEVRGILSHGSALAWNRKGNRANLADAVWAALGDAMEVLDASPDREKMWLRSGTRAASWSAATALTKTEVAELEKLQVLAGIKLGGGLVRNHRERDLNTAMATLELLAYVRSTKNGERLTKAAIVLLRGDDQAVASQVYRPGRPHDRRDTYAIRQSTTRAIIAGLERQFGEVPGFDRIASIRGLTTGHTSPVHSPQSFS